VHSLIALQDETAVSAARGTIRQRLARWLLLAQDRLGREINLTHDFLGVMLGVRRAGVTNALGAFCEEGLIEASRGRITIIDRDHLLVAAAGFYGSARSEYDRLFSRHL
jgi:CRP-like cAMP-binding protein